MTLSIIIVNYNGEQYLSDCLKSINRNCKGIEYEIIVVDNASNDNSVQLLKTKFDDSIILIESKTNVGFAKGNNLGVKQSKGNYLLLLNNDTILLNNLNDALEVFKQENIGVVSIKMLGKDKKYRYSAGYFPSPTRLLKLSRLYKKNKEFKKGDFKNKLYQVNWVEGSFILTTKEIWDAVNGLDENYFMYVEDIDFCKKVSLKNYKTMYYPKLEYIHFGGYGTHRENLLKNGFNTYIKKHMKEPIKTFSRLSIEINYLVKRIKKRTLAK